jgi:transcription termination factor Rho
VQRQGGEEAPPADADAEAGAGDGADADADTDADTEPSDEPAEEPKPRRRARGRRGGRAAAASADGDSDAADEPAEPRGRSRARADSAGEPRADAAPARSEDRLAAGTVELLGNGSGFLRVNPPDPSDEDVYISAAQVRRCELVSGDRVSGPVRPPRRSERYPSLVRVDTINDTPADEVTEGTHYEDLPAAFPTERFSFGSEDPTLKAIEWLTPIGRGSRVTIVGGARAGKTEALRRVADALAGQDGINASLVLTAVRPEEISEWKLGTLQPVAALTFAASSDAQSQAVERAVETAKRIAARGEHAVVMIDTLDGVQPAAARKALAAARNIVDGGSLTVIATASAPLGGETTVIALDAALASTGRVPALDLVSSGALRPELLVGAAGAEAIAQARAAALE